MKLPIEIIEGGKLPTRATAKSAGLDCYARLSSPLSCHPGDTMLVPLGFKLGGAYFHGGLGHYEVQVRGRSGLARRGLMAHLGTIDADYRGEVGVILHNVSRGETFVISPGDRVAQMVVCPIILPTLRQQLVAVDTERGEGGFGSTGQ